MQGGLPGLIARHVGPPLGVDVETKPDQKPDRAALTARGRPRHQGRARGADLVSKGGEVGQQRADRDPVVGERRGNERVGPVQIEARRTVRNQVLHELRMAGRGGHRRRGGAVVEWRREVDAVGDEQLHSFGHAVGDHPGELAADQFGRGGEGIAKPPSPRSAVAGPEAELDEQLQMVIPCGPTTKVARSARQRHSAQPHPSTTLSMIVVVRWWRARGGRVPGSHRR